MNEQLQNGRRAEFSSWLDQFSSQEDLSVLQSRLELYKKSSDDTSLEEEEYIHFRLGEHESYAINYKYVEEIFNPSEITPVPCVPEYVAGVINRRSNLLAVFDLRVLLSIEKFQEDQGKIWVIVVSSEDVNYSVCILANEVYGNDTYVVDQLASPIQSASIKNASYVKGIIYGRITLLDIGAILLDENLRVNS